MELRDLTTMATIQFSEEDLLLLSKACLLAGLYNDGSEPYVTPFAGHGAPTALVRTYEAAAMVFEAAAAAVATHTVVQGKDEGAVTLVALRQEWGKEGAEVARGSGAGCIL